MKKSRNRREKRHKEKTLVGEICRNNVAWVEKSIQDGLDVNSPEGRSPPLCVASMFGHLLIVDMLIKAGAKIDQIDHDKNMPINLAAKHDRAEVVNRLLQEKPSREIINHINRFYETPLAFAAKNSNIKILKMLVDAGAKVNYPDANTLSEMSKQSASKDVVRFFPLSAVIAEMNWQKYRMEYDEYKWKKNCAVHCVTELIKAGADLSDESYLVQAAEHLEVVKVLLDAGCNTGRLMDAIRKAIPCHSESALYMLKNAPQGVIEELLEWALANDNSTVVDFLINKAKDFQGFDVLKAHVVKVLLDSGCKTERLMNAIRNALLCYQSESALHMLKNVPHAQLVIKELLEWALVKNRSSTVDFLIKETKDFHGLDVVTSAVNCKYRNENFRFIDTENTKCIRALMKAGCDANATEIEGGSMPLFTASKMSHTNEIMKEFLLAGADVRSKHSNGLNVLESALQYRCGSLEYHAPNSNGFDVDVYHVYREYKKTVEFEESCKMLVKLLFAAGASTDKVINTAETGKDTASEPWLQIVNTNRNIELSLLTICRQQIRSYLLSPSGANKENLLIAIPSLPLPAKLKSFLLYDVDITEIRDIRPQIDDICENYEQMCEWEANDFADDYHEPYYDPYYHDYHDNREYYDPYDS